MLRCQAANRQPAADASAKTADNLPKQTEELPIFKTPRQQTQERFVANAVKKLPDVEMD